MKPLRLIAGLGNPGVKYTRTRHNAGFWFVDEIAKRHGGQWRSERRFHGEIARITIARQDVWLIKSAAFMNQSGCAVAAVCGFYRYAPAEILVAHDEIDLPPGAIRFKFAGGHGGHNGLRDIFAPLGREFWRVRIGVGHPGHRDAVIQYVLAPPSCVEMVEIEHAIDAALEQLPKLVSGDSEHAMQALHTR